MLTTFFFLCLKKDSNRDTARELASEANCYFQEEKTGTKVLIPILLLAIIITSVRSLEPHFSVSTATSTSARTWRGVAKRNRVRLSKLSCMPC